MKTHRILLHNIKKLFKQNHNTNPRNQTLLNVCKDLGYPLPNIRRALIVINNIDVPTLAEKENISKPRLYDAIKNDEHNGRSKEILCECLRVRMEDLYSRAVNH